MASVDRHTSVPLQAFAPSDVHASPGDAAQFASIFKSESAPRLQIASGTCNSRIPRLDYNLIHVQPSRIPVDTLQREIGTLTGDLVDQGTQGTKLNRANLLPLQRIRNDANSIQIAICHGQVDRDKFRNLRSDLRSDLTELLGGTHVVDEQPHGPVHKALDEAILALERAIHHLPYPCEKDDN